MKSSSLKIIAETPDYLVIEKPTGLLVHPTVHHEGPTLVDELVRLYPKIKKVGDDPTRPGIVHRLDREVSGLMVVAKTQPMFEYLKEQFAGRTIHKEYLALVHGKLSKDEGEIDFVIARSRHGGRMAARPSSQEGRTAKTMYDVVERFPNATLVRVMPETGRTHQIRAHFHALGHPLVGDRLYRTKKQRRKELLKSKGEDVQTLGKFTIPRLMLHATKLSFPDLEEKIQTFESTPPSEFSNFIKTLKHT